MTYEEAITAMKNGAPELAATFVMEGMQKGDWQKPEFREKVKALAAMQEANEGQRGRPVKMTEEEILETVRDMDAAGEKLTVKALRERLGGGSPNRLAPIIREYRARDVSSIAAEKDVDQQVKEWEQKCEEEAMEDERKGAKTRKRPERIEPEEDGVIPF